MANTIHNQNEELSRCVHNSVTGFPVQLHVALAPLFHRDCLALGNCQIESGATPTSTSCLMGARLTALTKPNGGVRWIATGCTVRGLVARTLAKTVHEGVRSGCAPFQHALSTRAGTDCV